MAGAFGGFGRDSSGQRCVVRVVGPALLRLRLTAYYR